MGQSIGNQSHDEFDADPRMAEGGRRYVRVTVRRWRRRSIHTPRASI